MDILVYRSVFVRCISLSPRKTLHGSGDQTLLLSVVCMEYYGSTSGQLVVHGGCCAYPKATKI